LQILFRNAKIFFEILYKCEVSASLLFFTKKERKVRAAAKKTATNGRACDLHDYRTESATETRIPSNREESEKPDTAKFRGETKK